MKISLMTGVLLLLVMCGFYGIAICGSIGIESNDDGSLTLTDNRSKKQRWEAATQTDTKKKHHVAKATEEEKVILKVRGGVHKVRGAGPKRSKNFRLQAGLTYVGWEHEGECKFEARLWDTEGEAIVIVKDEGSQTGNKTIDVPSAGTYRLEVLT